jgi:hypothetical protein
VAVEAAVMLGSWVALSKVEPVTFDNGEPA